MGLAVNRPKLFYAGKRINNSVRPGQGTLVLVVLFLAACGLGGGPRYGHQHQLQGEAVITCSQECADRGQCGTIPDQNVVVLGGVGGPATNFHDFLLPSNSRVNINGAVARSLQPLVGGEPFPMTFYHVTAIDETKSGWVAGWCIAAP